MMKRKVFALSLVTALTASQIFTGVVDVDAAAKPKKITLTAKSQNLFTGEMYTLGVKKVTPKNASAKVTYKSSKKAVASVTGKGVVKAKKAGNAVITVTSKTNKKVKATCKIKVKKGVANKSIKLNSTSLTLDVGGSSSLKVATWNPKNTSSKKVTWTTSNAKVATVSSKGNVVAVASGSATITATSSYGKKARCTVTVNAPAAAAPAPAAPAPAAPVVQTPVQPPATDAPAGPEPVTTPEPSQSASPSASPSVTNSPAPIVTVAPQIEAGGKEAEYVIPKDVEEIKITGLEDDIILTAKDIEEATSYMAKTPTQNIEEYKNTTEYTKKSGNYEVNMTGEEGSTKKVLKLDAISTLPAGKKNYAGEYDTDLVPVAGKENVYTFTMIKTKDASGQEITSREVVKEIVIDENEGTYSTSVTRAGVEYDLQYSADEVKMKNANGVELVFKSGENGYDVQLLTDNVEEYIKNKDFSVGYIPKELQQ